MKKILSGLAIVALGFGTVQSAFAAPTMSATPIMTTSVKSTSAAKQARMAVESDILGMQQDGVKALRSILDKYVLQDKKETGNMKFNVNMKSGDSETKVGVELEKYVSLTSIIKGEQEFGAKGTVTVSMSGSSYNYDATPTMGEYGYREYPKVPTKLDVKVTFDGNVKMADGYVYFLLSEFKTERTGTDKEVKEFDEQVAEVQKYVGKTYRISTKDADIQDANDAIKKFNSVLTVLETKSLFEVVSTKGNVSTLRLKKSTLQAINLAVGKPKNSGLKAAIFQDKDVKLSYEKTANGGVLLAKDRSGKSTAQLTRDNGEYTFEAKSNQKNVRLKTQETMSLKITKNSFAFKNATSSKYSTTHVDMTWVNNQLDVKVHSGYQGYSGDVSSNQSFSLSGPLNLENGNMDLKAKVNEKEVGSIKIQTLADGSIDYAAAFDIDYVFFQFAMTLTGNERLEYGAVDIVTPTTFETIK